MPSPTRCTPAFTLTAPARTMEPRQGRLLRSHPDGRERPRSADSTNILEYNAKHVSGVPRDCAMVDALFLDTVTNLSYMAAPENILKGHVTYINVANGTAIDAEPTAIENFPTDSIIVYPRRVTSRRAWLTVTIPATMNFLDNGAVVTVRGHCWFGRCRVRPACAPTSVINEFATGAGAVDQLGGDLPDQASLHGCLYAVTGPTLATARHRRLLRVVLPTRRRLGWQVLRQHRHEPVQPRGRHDQISVDDTQFSPYNPSNPTVCAVLRSQRD